MKLTISGYQNGNICNKKKKKAEKKKQKIVIRMIMATLKKVFQS